MLDGVKWVTISKFSYLFYISLTAEGKATLPEPKNNILSFLRIPFENNRL